MSVFSDAFSIISDFLQAIVVVPQGIGQIVNNVPYCSFILGLSVVLGFLTWLLKAALRG